MKKTYEKPLMEVTEFRFAEHIATSGDVIGSCKEYRYDSEGNVITSGCVRPTLTDW